MQRCQYCGSEFPDYARFCGKCGRPATSSAAFVGAPAPSSPPRAAPAVPPGSFEQRGPGWSDVPLTPQAATGVQEQEPPVQDFWLEQHRRPQLHDEHDGRRAASGLPGRKGTRLILIAILALLLVALGSGALVFALRPQAPAPAGTPLAAGKSRPTGAHRNAAATVTASPRATSGPAADTFNFTGAIAGPMVISSFLQCGARSGSYFMQVKGTIGDSSYTFLIGLLSYHGPGSYTSNLTINLVKVGTVVSLNNDGRLPVTITVTSNGKAGAVSSDLAGLVNVAQPQLSTGHVSGSWTCA